MAKYNGEAIHTATKPGTKTERDINEGQRDPEGKAKLNGLDHTYGQPGDINIDGSEHRSRLDHPYEPKDSKCTSGRAPLGGHNSGGNGYTQSCEQRTSGQDIRLPDRRLSLEFVALEAIPTVWDRFGVGQLFKETEWRSGGRWNAEYLFEKLVLEHMQLWLIIEKKTGKELIRASLVTDVRPYETGFKACHIIAVVGKEPRSWIKLKSELEAWAKRSGCEAIETICRVGWKRFLPDWKQTHIFIEKRL